ncbi:MAG TPA: SCO family protein [Longimicrobiales bacterium]|nr:SCO family protein [Longimicrobiales bacterium]
MKRSRAALAALLLAGGTVLWVGLRAVGPEAQAQRDARRAMEAREYRGAELPDPMPKPAFTLTDMYGHPFDFVAETDGRLTLLFFGFTNCPDICPVHMANIAAVLKDLPQPVQQQIRVVFISADPDRDTPEKLQQWLGVFHPSFIGLRGSIEEVNDILAELRLPPVVFGEVDERGNYSVGHAAQILAFTPDGYLRLMYPFGTRQADWAVDLLKLTSWEPPAGAPADAPPRPSQLRPSMAYVPVPAGEGPAALYITVASRAAAPDTLVGAHTRVAGRVELHGHAERDGTMIMERLDGVPVQPGDSLRLMPGGYHLMLHDLTHRLAAGDTFTVELEFRRAGRVAARSVVIPYSAVERMLSASERQEGH